MKTFLAAVLCAAALTAQAGDLKKFRNWDDSPQGYFMTADERTAWKAVRSDAEAETFVAEFLAKRGGDAFAAEVAKRAEMADKYLSIGKVKGSTMLRGKVIILLGPPASMNVSNATVKSGGSNGLGADAYQNVGSSGMQSMSDSDPGGIGRGGSSRSLKLYNFTYSGKAVAPLAVKEYTIDVEVDAGNGKDRLQSGKKMNELQQLFDAAAAASIK